MRKDCGPVPVFLADAGGAFGEDFRLACVVTQLLALVRVMSPAASEGPLIKEHQKHLVLVAAIVAATLLALALVPTYDALGAAIATLILCPDMAGAGGGSVAEAWDALVVRTGL